MSRAPEPAPVPAKTLCAAEATCREALRPEVEEAELEVRRSEVGWNPMILRSIAEVHFAAFRRRGPFRVVLASTGEVRGWIDEASYPEADAPALSQEAALAAAGRELGIEAPVLEALEVGPGRRGGQVVRLTIRGPGSGPPVRIRVDVDPATLRVLSCVRGLPQPAGGGGGRR